MVSQGILKYCLKGLLDENQRKALYKFLDVSAELLAEKLNPDKLPSLLYNVNSCLAQLEKDMPMTIQVRSNHMHMHA